MTPSSRRSLPVPKNVPSTGVGGCGWDRQDRANQRDVIEDDYIAGRRDNSLATVYNHEG
ncbi:hypothetical protein HSR122_1153 [Halapricum desulfuricans]|uniref:Uncharacterized protein n=1 Tax=Halapricum desulfuricans TaxID=2841257 RepID=A0A897N6X6_9EURY|nr:hypothetical protein HSR122_1153 [Halapricum desulfuricans]